MFRPARMLHVEVLLSQHHLLPVAEYLGHRGALHLTRSSRRSGATPAASRDDARALEAYRTLTERLTKLLRFFEIPEETPRPVDRAPSRIVRDAAQLAQELERLEHEAEDIEAALALLTEENARMALLREQIHPIAFLDADLTMLHEFRHMTKALGTLPTEILPRLEKGLSGYNAIIVPLRTLGTTTVIMAFAAAAHEEVLRYALRSAFFKEIVLPERLRGTPRAILQTIDEITEENAEGIAALTEERTELAERRRARLLELWYQINDNRRTFEVIGLFLKTRDAYIITGWLPEREFTHLEHEVDVITGHTALVTSTRPSSDDRAVPTCLENPALVAPFEVLTEAYGLPAYDERDPTVFLALSSLVMFGTMFGDVGHGLALALVGLVVRHLAGDDRPDARRLATVGVMFGCSATLFGFVFGSVFGREELVRPLWHAPMHVIMPLFRLSCTFGAGLVMLGLVLNVYTLARRRAWGRMLCDKFGLAGLWFYLAFLWTAVGILADGPAAVTTVHQVLLVLPLGLIALRHPVSRVLEGPEHTEGTVADHLIEAVVELFETILTFFSNTMSFIRLGAFALCHAGLSQTVYVLADTVAGGGPFGVVLAVLGNCFIVLFEGLIVAIQTMRLEYYEFFSKFFRAGGTPYRPFALRK